VAGWVRPDPPPRALWGQAKGRENIFLTPFWAPIFLGPPGPSRRGVSQDPPCGEVPPDPLGRFAAGPPRIFTRSPYRKSPKGCLCKEREVSLPQVRTEAWPWYETEATEREARYQADKDTLTSAQPRFNEFGYLIQPINANLFLAKFQTLTIGLYDAFFWSPFLNSLNNRLFPVVSLFTLVIQVWGSVCRSRVPGFNSPDSTLSVLRSPAAPALQYSIARAARLETDIKPTLCCHRCHLTQKLRPHLGPILDRVFCHPPVGGVGVVFVRNDLASLRVVNPKNCLDRVRVRVRVLWNCLRNFAPTCFAGFW